MMPWLEKNCKFAALNVEYLYAGSEDGSIDQELLDEAWAITKTSGINILRNQDLHTIAVLNGHAVGALFVSTMGPSYSFDVVVHPKYQRQGIGFELAKIGNGLQHEYGFEEQFPEGLKHNIATPEGGRLVEKLKSKKKISSKFIKSICKFAHPLNPNQPEPLSGDVKVNPTLKKDIIPSLAEIEAAWDARGIQNAMHENGGIITLNKIIVPKEQRGSGIGTAAMQELIDYADKTGQRIALSPSIDFGGNKARLESFYRGFGFKKYKGFDVRETMMRDPQNKPSPILNKRQFLLNICKFAQQQKLLDFDPPETFSGDIKTHPKIQKQVSETVPYGADEEEYMDGFYHVTTNLPAVLQWGALKSRKQLGGDIPGLGGGERNEAVDKISLTHSLQKAYIIFNGLKYAAKICSNQISASHILNSTLQDYDFPDDMLMESDVKSFLEGFMTEEEMGEDGENIDSLLDQRIKTPKQKYDFLTRLESVLNVQMSAMDENFVGPPVGFTVPYETFCQLNQTNIAIVKLQVRKGAPYEHVPQELELRFDPDDVRLADNAVIERA